MSYVTWQIDLAPPAHVLTVSELTGQVRNLLEGTFPDVWVAGEISGYKRAQSGHVYLALKDDRAQLRAILWRGTASRLPFQLHDGLEVVARGGLRVYQPRGTYELIIDWLQPKGLGPLELALRQLKEKLAGEGLFDPEHKKALPRFPRRVVMVTSPAGAAVHDLVQVMSRRWPAVELLLLPVRVQGEGAAQEIASAIQQANGLADVDVVIVARGGGSLEDLWAFNEEVVARAIFASQVPVVSAVGHEIDVTIADLVADRRALTPSEAGELIVPDCEEVMQRLIGDHRRLMAGLRARVSRARTQVEALSRHRLFRRPLDRVYDLQRDLEQRAQRARRAVDQRLRLARQHGERLAHALESLSPLAVLARGYSVTFAEDCKTVLRESAQVDPGQQITTRLYRGRLVSRVEQRVDQE